MKTETIAWKDFFAGGAPQQVQKKTARVTIPFVTTAVVVALLTQDAVHAHTATAAMFHHPHYFEQAVAATAPPETGWVKAKHEILHILDYVCWGVIVFCGGSWLFGHKNKALDMLISCGIGTVIIIHADDIENFFKSI